MRALLVAASLATAPLVAPADPEPPHWQARGCDHGHGYRAARSGLVSIMRAPAPLTPTRAARAHHFVVCTMTGGQSRRLHRYARRLHRWRRSYPIVWQLREARLSPYIRATLARLRGCETRGIPFPHNYRYDGIHDGAYQYTVSTWQRAQAWYPGRVAGWTPSAHQAAPAHQDVITAFFFPSHRGEWACSA